LFRLAPWRNLHAYATVSDSRYVVADCKAEDHDVKWKNAEGNIHDCCERSREWHRANDERYAGGEVRLSAPEKCNLATQQEFSRRLRASIA